MSSDDRGLDLDEQLQSFAITLEVDAGEPIRPDPRRPHADGREPGTLELTPSQPDRRHWLLPAVAAAAVIVVVVAGLVVLSNDDAPSDPQTPAQTVAPAPEPTAEPEPTAVPEPTVAPEPTVEPEPSAVPDQTVAPQVTEASTVSAPNVQASETQSTIIGDITWTLIEGDSSNLPASVLAEIDGEFFGEGGGRTWRSSDGIAWEVTNLALNGVRDVFEFDGETWARTSFGDGQGLARWDGASFVPMDLSASLAPEVDGLEASAGFGAYPVEFGGELVVPIWRHLHLSESWDELCSGQVLPEWDPVTRTICIVDPDSGDPMVLRTELVKGDSDRVEFRDAETGELVTTVGLVPGADPDDYLRRLVVAKGYSYSELLIGDGDGFNAVETPWRFAYGAGVSALDGRMFSIVPYIQFEDFGQEWKAWTSVDARTWAPLELPTPIGGQIDSMGIVSDGSLALLTIESSEGSLRRSETWSTVDGTRWEPVEDDGGQYGTQITDIGWFRDATVDGGGISVSPDGLVWQEIPIDLDEMAGAGGGGVTVLGRTIFASTYEVGGEHQMWVGRVADG